jgi:hypothetical protein
MRRTAHGWGVLFSNEWFTLSIADVFRYRWTRWHIHVDRDEGCRSLLIVSLLGLCLEVWC